MTGQELYILYTEEIDAVFNRDTYKWEKLDHQKQQVWEGLASTLAEKEAANVH